MKKYLEIQLKLYLYDSIVGFRRHVVAIWLSGETRARTMEGSTETLWRMKVTERLLNTRGPFTS